MSLPIIVCVVLAATTVLAFDKTSKGCMDQSPECPRWSAEGECQSNPLWMGPNCPLSCRLCVGPQQIRIEEISDGVGKCRRPSRKGDILKVHYTGTLASDGKQFDSSIGKEPYGPFELGAGQVIMGVDQGLHGLCLGDKRKLTIPPELAYGSRGVDGVIPGGATLIFDYELVEINNAPGCKDQMPDCVTWAKDGECKKNPVWMKPNCPVSCGLCDKVVKCVDLYKEDCLMWMKRGECTSLDNRIWMFFNCPKTCNMCNVKFEG